MQDAHAQRGGRGRVDQPRLAVRLRRADGPVDDAFVAELGAVEERVEGVDQPLVAPPVRRERRLGDGAVGGAEVGVDVGSAEGVHRLLWVADEDQRRLSLAEGAPHDLPLDRVGVLELVDERNVVLLAQLRAGGGAVVLVGERVPEAGEQVVVGHDSAAPLARLDLRAHGFREAAPHRPRLRLVSRASLDRLEAGEGVADRGSSDPESLGPVERRPRDSVEAADVEVVDDLLDEIGQVLDERHVALDVAGDAESREHVLAEAVRGRDGGGVEARDGIGEPAPPHRHLGVGAIGKQLEHAVVRRRCHAGERACESQLRGHEPVAHPLSQLAGRHPRERHDQELRRWNALGDEPSDQSGDRERLPRAGARLEQRHAARKRPAEVELPHPARRAHRSISSSRARSPSQSRRAYRPARDGSSIAQPSPCSSSRGGSSNSSSTVRVPPSTSRCSGSASSFGKFQSDGPFLPGSSPSVLAGGDRGGVRGRGLAVERQRLAHPALEEVDEHGKVAQRLRLPGVRGVGETDAGDGHLVPPRPIRPAPAERDRLVGSLRVRGGEREQVDPRGQPVPRRDPRVGQCGDEVAADAGHRPDQRATFR